jgi:hypothetical protein
MKIETSDLTGTALDWAVGKAGGWHKDYPYSTDWVFGGPIIEREELHVLPTGDAAKWKAYRWIDHGNEAGNFSRESYGPAPLIAAMRCFVASKLGETVDVPDELLEK